VSASEQLTREIISVVAQKARILFRSPVLYQASHINEGRSDGEIPRKYRELIALGAAFTTQCAYCIDTRTRHARAHGASKQEIAETAFVVAAVKTGGTLANSLLALRLFDEEEKAGVEKGQRLAGRQGQLVPCRLRTASDGRTLIRVKIFQTDSAACLQTVSRLLDTPQKIVDRFSSR
jgi:AhpD family alkylhydroperoxidase